MTFLRCSLSKVCNDIPAQTRPNHRSCLVRHLCPSDRISIILGSPGAPSRPFARWYGRPLLVSAGMLNCFTCRIQTGKRHKFLHFQAVYLVLFNLKGSAAPPGPHWHCNGCQAKLSQPGGIPIRPGERKLWSVNAINTGVNSGFGDDAMVRGAT